LLADPGGERLLAKLRIEKHVELLEVELIDRGHRVWPDRVEQRVAAKLA
jgi:hypothetical protein